MNNTIRLDGKVVILTGASRGLGRALAGGLAEAGARIVLAARASEQLAATASEIQARYGKKSALAVPTDISRRSECESLLRRALDEHDQVHVIINNAMRRLNDGPGLRPALPFWEVTEDFWKEILDVNVHGAINMASVAAPVLIKQGWGRIINVSTSIGTLQRLHNSPYGTTKAAIEAATAIWAKDLAGTGVTVNAMLPGGRCENVTDFEPKGGEKPLPVTVMNPVAVWLSSDLSDGKTGGRYQGKLWDTEIPPQQAALAAKDLPVLRVPPASSERNA